MKEFLEKLCTIKSVSGSEEDTLQTIKKLVSPFAAVETDFNNNAVVTIGNTTSETHIMFDAHIDQIGLIISYIDDEGFLKAEPCGGIDARVLAGSSVKVLGTETLNAIVCCLPPHLNDGKEDTAMQKDEIWLDVGLDKESVESFVSLGDKAIIYNEPKTLLNNQISATSLDNSVGVAVLIETIKQISKKELNCKVSFLFSSQEEVGGLGAKTATYKLQPTEAIVVDVSFAMQPGISPQKAKEMGKGVMIGTSPVLNKELYNELKDIAQKEDIPFQTEVMSGLTGTNADSISVNKYGVKTGLVSIPIKNMHTQSEIVKLDDMECAVKLLYNYILKRSSEVK